MAKKRPKVALGARFLTGGAAFGGTIGLVAIMQAHANDLAQKRLESNATSTTTTAPAQTVAKVVIPLGMDAPTTTSATKTVNINIGTTSGVKPATPVSKNTAPANTVPGSINTTPGIVVTTTTQAPTITPAPTTTQAPAPCVTRVSTGKCI